MLHFEPSGSSLRFLPLLLALSGGEGREGSRQGGLYRGGKGSRAGIPNSHPSQSHTAHPAGPAQQRMGRVRSTSTSPGRAEQVGLELLKARARTEPSDHPPQLENPPGRVKPPSPCPAPRFSPSTGSDEDPQTPNHSHNIGESSTSVLTRARQAQNQTDPSPSSLTPVSNLP